MGNRSSSFTNHVANGCSHGIWVVVDKEEAVVTEKTKEFLQAAQGSLPLSEIGPACGFVNILPGKYSAFQLYNVTGCVFLSIYYQNDQLVEKICHVESLSVDQSLVVGLDNKAHPVRYGHIWLSNNGRDHSLRDYEEPSRSLLTGASICYVDSLNIDQSIHIEDESGAYLFNSTSIGPIEVSENEVKEVERSIDSLLGELEVLERKIPQNLAPILISDQGNLTNTENVVETMPISTAAQVHLAKAE